MRSPSHGGARGSDRSRRPLVLVVVGAALLLLGLLVVPVQPAAAGFSNHGEPQVIVNPGGGVETDGSDGVKMSINDSLGRDQLHFQNTTQYCCGAVAPSLNIGGTLYGEAGAASGSASWTDLEIVSTSGSTTTAPGVAPRCSATRPPTAPGPTF